MQLCPVVRYLALPELLADDMSMCDNNNNINVTYVNVNLLKRS